MSKSTKSTKAVKKKAPYKFKEKKAVKKKDPRDEYPDASQEQLEYIMEADEISANAYKRNLTRSEVLRLVELSHLYDDFPACFSGLRTQLTNIYENQAALDAKGELIQLQNIVYCAQHRSGGLAPKTVRLRVDAIELDKSKAGVLVFDRTTNARVPAQETYKNLRDALLAICDFEVRPYYDESKEFKQFPDAYFLTHKQTVAVLCEDDDPTKPYRFDCKPRESHHALEEAISKLIELRFPSIDCDEGCWDDDDDE